MNEDTFNMEIRKFLKKVGITSQREIENAVREEPRSKLRGITTCFPKGAGTKQASRYCTCSE